MVVLAHALGFSQVSFSSDADTPIIYDVVLAKTRRARPLVHHLSFHAVAPSSSLTLLSQTHTQTNHSILPIHYLSQSHSQSYFIITGYLPY
jgi:hypothetical protein